MKPDTETCQHPSTRRQEQGTGAVWSPQSQFLTGEGAEPETQRYPLENNTEDSPRGPTPPTPGCAAFWGVPGTPAACSSPVPTTGRPLCTGQLTTTGQV